eukprot:4476645-Prymnesium_polylepis.1
MATNALQPGHRGRHFWCHGVRPYLLAGPGPTGAVPRARKGSAQSTCAHIKHTHQATATKTKSSTQQQLKLFPWSYSREAINSASHMKLRLARFGKRCPRKEGSFAVINPQKE